MRWVDPEEPDALSRTSGSVRARGGQLPRATRHRTGFALYAKRLERGRFVFPSVAESQELSEQTLRFLLDGIPLGGRR
jgi:hypothetical protein